MLSTVRVNWIRTLLIVFGLAAAAFTARTSPAKARSNPQLDAHSSHSLARLASVRTQRPVTQHRETKPFIDGAEAPEKIPDAVAYGMFLRMLLARDSSEVALKRQRSYIRHVVRNATAGLAGKGATLGPPASIGTVTEGVHIEHHDPEAPTDAEIDAMLRFVRSYESRLRAFDARRGSMGEERAVAMEIVSTMPDHLGVILSDAVDRYVIEHFKRKVKIVY